jgi:hypothetical protein
VPVSCSPRRRVQGSENAISFRAGLKGEWRSCVTGSRAQRSTALAANGGCAYADLRADCPGCRRQPIPEQARVVVEHRLRHGFGVTREANEMLGRACLGEPNELGRRQFSGRSDASWSRASARFVGSSRQFGSVGRRLLTVPVCVGGPRKYPGRRLTACMS